MIIETERDVTAAVLAEAERAPDARFRQILRAPPCAICTPSRAKHASPKSEFQQLCCSDRARRADRPTASHNEVVLAAGSLGVSALVCRLNNALGGSEPTTANLLRTRSGAKARLMLQERRLRCFADATAGAPHLRHSLGARHWTAGPSAGARVDVWHTSAEGFYENQDPEQPDMNSARVLSKPMHRRQGLVPQRQAAWLPDSRPRAGRAILLRAQRRHNLRPAHIHFPDRQGLATETQFSQVYSGHDPNLER